MNNNRYDDSFNEEASDRFFKKLLITIGVVFGFVIVLGMYLLDEEQSTKKFAEHSEVHHKYNILELDFDDNDTQRISMRVLVEDPLTVETEDIDAISKEIIENAKKEYDFSALVIFYYDRMEDYDKAYRLGIVYYAPNGEWGEYRDALPNLGNYDNFKYNIGYGYLSKGVLPKDNPDYPSEEEFKIYEKYLEYVNNAIETTGELPYDTDVFNSMAQELGMSYEEVRSIVYKASER